MSYPETSRENCLRGKEHGNAYRQREIYDLLQERGPMTATEIGKEVGLGRDSVRSFLQKLQRDGFVEKGPNITNPGKPLYEVADDE